MSPKNYVHLRTQVISEPTKCSSPGHVTWLGMGQEEENRLKNLEFFWANSIQLRKKIRLGWSYSRTYKHLSVMRVTAGETYFQAFPLISCPEHNIFFLSFSPSRGATSIVYRCKQKGTQKPYALKVLKKTVSLFHYITASLRDLWPGEAGSPDLQDKEARELLCAANSLKYWVWECSQMGCSLTETVWLFESDWISDWIWLWGEVW